MRERLEDLGIIMEKVDQMLDSWPAYPDHQDKFVLYFSHEDPKDTLFADRLERLYHELCNLKGTAFHIYKIAKGAE